jgi:hypothetical protein
MEYIVRNHLGCEVGRVEAVEGIMDALTVYALEHEVPSQRLRDAGYTCEPVRLPTTNETIAKMLRASHVVQEVVDPSNIYHG